MSDVVLHEEDVKMATLVGDCMEIWQVNIGDHFGRCPCCDEPMTVVQVQSTEEIPSTGGLRKPIEMAICFEQVVVVKLALYCKSCGYPLVTDSEQDRYFKGLPPLKRSESCGVPVPCKFGGFAPNDGRRITCVCTTCTTKCDRSACVPCDVTKKTHGNHWLQRCCNHSDPRFR